MLLFDKLAENEYAARHQALARKALRAYNMTDATLVLLRQHSPMMFDVRLPGAPAHRYLLRLCRATSDLRIPRRELLWLIAIRCNTNLVVPEPVLAQDGQLLRSVSHEGVSGARACLLLRWVDGFSVRAEIAVQHTHAIGRAIAQLHDHGAVYRWPTELTPPRLTPESVSELGEAAMWRTVCTASELRPVREALDVVAERMQDLGDDSSVAGVVHGNLHLRNIVFHENEPRLIDFRGCSWGYFAYDLSRMVSDLLSREQGPALVDGLLAGYRSVRSLSEPAEAALGAFSFLHHVLRTRRMLEDEERDEARIARHGARMNRLAKQVIRDES